MIILQHILLFCAAIAAIWFFAGLIVESTEHVARRFNKSGFVVAFFLLGFLTSLGEISVAINSVIEGVPQVSAGNLAGASFVLLFLVVPILAVAAGKIRMNKVFEGWRLAVVLGIIALPSVFMADGVITVWEGVAAAGALCVLMLIIRKYNAQEVVHHAEHVMAKRSITFDAFKVVVSAVVVFFSGHLLVNETVFFSELLAVPKSVTGILLLSIGTNIPELAIALRAVLQKRSEVAFGNYLGSATMNTAIFAFLAIVSRSFVVEQEAFLIMLGFVGIGFLLFYFFIRSRDSMSRTEGGLLLSVYVAFLVIQVVFLAS